MICKFFFVFSWAPFSRKIPLIIPNLPDKKIHKLHNRLGALNKNKWRSFALIDLNLEADSMLSCRKISDSS